MTDPEPTNYWELGFELFGQEPELLLVEVWRRTMTWAWDDAREFVAGYTAARRQKDNYHAEADA